MRLPSVIRKQPEAPGVHAEPLWSLRPQSDREAGDAGADDFPATGVTRHEMRFDEAGGDLEVGAGVAVVDPDRHAAVGGAQVIVLLLNLAVVVEAAVVAGDLGADQFLEFGALVGAVGVAISALMTSKSCGTWVASP